MASSGFMEFDKSEHHDKFHEILNTSFKKGPGFYWFTYSLEFAIQALGAELIESLPIEQDDFRVSVLRIRASGIIFCLGMKPMLPSSGTLEVLEMMEIGEKFERPE